MISHDADSPITLDEGTISVSNVLQLDTIAFQVRVKLVVVNLSPPGKLYRPLALTKCR